jgi:hypothetical protein
MRAWKLLHDCDFCSFQLICEDIRFFSPLLLDFFRKVGREDNTIVISESGRMRRRPLMVLLTAAGTARTMSETAVGTEQRPSWQTFWQGEGQQPQYPASVTEHPHLKMRRTHVEWRMSYGHGARLGSYGPTREIPDFEYRDGSPAPLSRRRFTFSHHQDQFLVQMIKAAAAVEMAAERQWLPRVPGTAEQRDWDPEIPLFLDDVDEHGKAPISHYTQKSTDALRSAARQDKVDEKFTKAGLVQKHQAINKNQPGGEQLEPITMFASYDPASFISEPIVKPSSNSRPIWSRRRWALTNEFLVPRNPKAKNTIKDL